MHADNPMGYIYIIKYIFIHLFWAFKMLFELKTRQKEGEELLILAAVLLRD